MLLLLMPMKLNVDANITFLILLWCLLFSEYLLIICINDINGHKLSVLNTSIITFLLLMSTTKKNAGNDFSF